MRFKQLLKNRVVHRLVAVAVAAVVIAVPAGPAHAGAETQSCAGWESAGPYDQGPIRVYAAGTPWIRCYKRTSSTAWKTVNITQVWEINGGTSGVEIEYTMNGQHYMSAVAPDSPKYFGTWGGPGAYLIAIR